MTSTLISNYNGLVPSSEHDGEQVRLLDAVAEGGAGDSVEALLAEWAAVEPDLDLATVAVVARLGRVRTHIAVLMDRVFAAHGMTAADFAAMSILRRRGSVPMGSLADGLYLTAGTVTPRVRRLVERGWAVVAADPDDGRVHRVALTTQGESAFMAAVPQHLAVQDRALRSLTSSDRRGLAGLLAVVLADLESAEPQ